MNYAKRMLATSACLMTAVCIAVFSAAPAAAAGNWLVKGNPITGAVEMEGSIDSEVLAFLVPALNFQLTFKKITYDEGTLLTGGESSQTFLITEGTSYTISPKKEIPSCAPGDLTFEVKSSLLLHNGKTYEVLVPQSGPLTVTTYGETCALLETNEVTGALVWEDASGSFSNEAVTHLVSQAPGALFSELQMQFGEHAMRLDGSVKLKLKGKEAGNAWSGAV